MARSPSDFFERLFNASDGVLLELHCPFSVTVFSFQSSSYCRVRSLFHVLRQSHPLDVESHGSRVEEPVVDVVHLLDRPSMGANTGWPAALRQGMLPIVHVRDVQTIAAPFLLLELFIDFSAKFGRLPGFVSFARSARSDSPGRRLEPIPNRVAD